MPEKNSVNDPLIKQKEQEKLDAVTHKVAIYFTLLIIVFFFFKMLLP
jgi:hypothetical protein